VSKERTVEEYVSKYQWIRKRLENPSEHTPVPEQYAYRPSASQLSGNRIPTALRTRNPPPCSMTLGQMREALILGAMDKNVGFGMKVAAAFAIEDAQHAERNAGADTGEV
jgi:hypothetical protein